ncbi:hypothetical protein Tamer19_47950 [Cupriavidus sp. TA19]|nr:hypothetical protein Tamer19_47950 [Cupriavidus sp. TA19]
MAFGSPVLTQSIDSIAWCGRTGSMPSMEALRLTTCRRRPALQRPLTVFEPVVDVHYSKGTFGM